MNASARLENKGPSFDGRERLSHGENIKSLFKNCSINALRTKNTELEKTHQLLFVSTLFSVGLEIRSS